MEKRVERRSGVTAGRVRFYFFTPAAFWGQQGPRPLMFDAILAYAKMRLENWGKTQDERFKLIDFDLPLDKEGVPGKEIWRASAMFVPDGYFAPYYVVRSGDWRQDMTWLTGGALRYECGQCWQRLYQEPYWLLVAPYIDFYFSGELDGVMELLEVIYTLGHLGSKRHSGLGKITRIEVDTHAPDWSVWKDEKPTRPIPVEMAPGKNLPMEVEAFAPPYWHPARKTMCYVPPVEQWYPLRVRNLLQVVGDKN